MVSPGVSSLHVKCLWPVKPRPSLYTNFLYRVNNLIFKCNLYLFFSISLQSFHIDVVNIRTVPFNDCYTCRRRLHVIL